MPKQTPVTTEDLQNLLNQLPSGDESLIVLKGHLIAEQLVRRYIEILSPNPTPVLELNRLSFATLVTIARSCSKANVGIQDLVWIPLGLLNTLRNWMAHDLDEKAHAKHIDRLIQNYESQPGAWRPKDYRQGSRVVRLRFAVVAVLHALTGTVMALHTGTLTKRQREKYLGVENPRRPRKSRKRLHSDAKG
jgi:hypothetical protein